jgi:hypothetical protein
MTAPTLTKKFVNSLDIGTVALGYTFTMFPQDEAVVPATPSWNETCHALITFPTYYPAHIGESIACTYSETADALTPIYC